MIIAEITGGLGNQLFQYALGKTLATNLNVPLKLDLSFFEDKHWERSKTLTQRNLELPNFNIQAETANKSELKQFLPLKQSFWDRAKRKVNRAVFNYQTIQEGQLSNPLEVLNISSKNSHLSGYWQSEQFFESQRELIRKEFTLKIAPSGENLRIGQSIQDSNAISLHVRRGDLVTNPEAHKLSGLCDMAYYEQAMNILEQSVDDPVYYIFSDDPEWVQENMKIKNTHHFITDNLDKKDHVDLWLMSQCKHHITANSTFSWWGAWLNPNPEKQVICPKNWFKDPSKSTKLLFPSGWKLI